MRLLEYNGYGELRLTTHIGDNFPSYAILSHTWGEDGEVTIQDVVTGTGKSKAGYEKIRFCRERAGRDGLQYFWIDTCCIDPSIAPNSRRLSTLCFAGTPMRLNATSI
jgi:hypothetical protein